MNLSKFLKETDLAAAELSKEDLIFFIHDLARTLDKKDREDFLYRIHMIRPENGQKRKITCRRRRLKQVRAFWMNAAAFLEN